MRKKTVLGGGLLAAFLCLGAELAVASPAEEMEEALLSATDSPLSTDLPRLSEEDPANLAPQMVIIQYGSDNRASISQGQDSGLRSLIFQSGSGNQASITAY
jgi:hypothetical protein